MNNEEEMSNIQAAFMGLLFIAMLIGLGYWWGNSNVRTEQIYLEPEVKIIEKSVYTEQKKCQKAGGFLETVDYVNFNRMRDFSVTCKIPAKEISI